MTQFSNRFAIGMPTYGDMETQTRKSVMAVMARHKHIHFVNVQGFSDVARARSEVAHKLLELPNKPEYHLWVDGDMVFSVDDVDRLLSDMDATPTAALVGSLYLNRNGTFPTAKDLHVPLGTEVAVGTTGGLIKYNGGGFGLTVVRSDAYDKLDCPPHPQTGKHWFFPTTDDNGQPLSEDLSFCYRAWKAGLECYIDTRVVPGHITKRPIYWYSGEQKPGPASGVMLWGPKPGEQAAE